MKYNSATDNYESEFLEPILDTNFKYGVPYKIDREKYENAFKKRNINSRIKDADVVVFHAHYNEDYDSYTFFAFPQNSPEGSKDFYDCSQFYEKFYDYDDDDDKHNDDKHDDDKHKESFENFTHFVDAILESVISPDKQYSEKLIAELQQEIDAKMKNIESLKNLL